MAKQSAPAQNAAPQSTLTTKAATPVQRKKQQTHAPGQEEETAGLMFEGTESGAAMDNVMRSLDNSTPSTPPESPKFNMAIQPQLTLGRVGDPYEQEADAVAAETVKILHRKILTNAGSDEDGSLSEGGGVQRSVQRASFFEVHPLVQRDGFPEGGGAVAGEIESGINSARGTGSSLPKQDRFEQVMGADFRKVTVHHNNKSDSLNRQLSSRAFTTGTDIFFKKGELNPGTPKGDELLAHELTHVKQQNPSINRKPVEQTSAPRVSRAVTGVIQRDYLSELDTVTAAGRSWYGKGSSTISLVKELLTGFKKNQESHHRYLYIQKAYRLLVYKKVKHSGTLETEITNYIDNTLQPVADRERIIFEHWLEEEQESQDDQAQEQQQGQTHHAKIKNLLAQHDEPLPDDDLDAKYSKFVGTSQGATKALGGFANRFKKGKKSGKGFTIETLDESQLNGWAADFRTKTKKGWGQQRGELLSNVDQLLNNAQAAYQEAKDAEDETIQKDQHAQRCVASLNMVLDMLELWLLKYGKDVHEARSQGNEEPGMGTLYQAVNDFYTLCSRALGKFAQKFKIAADSTLPAVGDPAATDEDVIAQLNHEHIMKKYGNKYKGDCGFFFGTLFPSIVNLLAPNVGHKGKFEMDVLFPVQPPLGVGFHLKVDSERKDEHELKTFADLLITTGFESPNAKATIGLGMYFEMVGNTAVKVGQLFSYGLYRRFRESKVIPRGITNFLWGGSGGTQGRFDAEAWAMGVEENIFGGSTKDKAASKAYVEAGFAGRLSGEGGGDSASAKADVLLGVGKRYSQESLMATSALVPLNAKGEVVNYPNHRNEFDDASVREAVTMYMARKTNGKPVKQRGWEHPLVLRQKDFDKANKGLDPSDESYQELSARDKATLVEVKKRDKIVKYVPTDEFHNRKNKNAVDSLLTGNNDNLGAEAAQGFDTIRLEVNARANIGDFVIGVKPKLEFLSPVIDDMEENITSLGASILRKVEIEFKGKYLGALPQLAGWLYGVGFTGGNKIVETVAKAWGDKSQKKSRKQEKADGGQRKRVLGEIMNTTAVALTGFGHVLNEELSNKTLGHNDLLKFESGGQVRIKLGWEAKDMMKQAIGKVLDKGKGEAHLEILAGLGIGVKAGSSVNKAIDVELASRMFSTKWEGKKGWAAIPFSNLVHNQLEPKDPGEDATEDEKAQYAKDLDEYNANKVAVKRMELFYGVKDLKQAPDVPDPTAAVKSDIKAGVLKAARVIAKKVLLEAGGMDAVPARDRDEVWHKTMVAQLNTLTPANTPGMGGQRMHGDAWKQAFLDALKSYTKLFTMVPSKYFQDLNPATNALDSVWLDAIMETGISKSVGWSKLYSELFGNGQLTPHLVMYHKGDTGERTEEELEAGKVQYDGEAAEDEAEDVAAFVERWHELIDGYFTPIAALYNPDNDDDPPSHDDAAAMDTDELAQKVINMPLDQIKVDVNPGPPRPGPDNDGGDPMPQVDLGSLRRILTVNFQEAKLLCKKIVAAVVLTPTPSAFEAAIRGAAGPWADPIYGHVVVLPTLGADSIAEVESYFTDEFFAITVSNGKPQLGALYQKCIENSDQLVLRDFTQAGTGMQVILDHLKATLDAIEKQMVKMRLAQVLAQEAQDTELSGSGVVGPANQKYQEIQDKQQKAKELANEATTTQLNSSQKAGNALKRYNELKKLGVIK